MDAERFMKMIGWYDGQNEVATHDPIPNNLHFVDVQSLEDIARCHCILCEKSLREGPVKSINIRYPNGLRSYFYRVHTFCWQGREQEASDKAWTMIEEHAMEQEASA